MKPIHQITSIRRLVRIALAAFALICNLPDANAGFAFTPSHLYSTWGLGDTRNIIEYSADGIVVGSITIPSLLEEDELRGIAFGTDGLLYAVMIHSADSGFSVLALDSSGMVHETYRMEGVYVAGDVASGKIALDQQYIYVAGGDDLVRFTVGDPASGVSIYTNNQVFDVNILPTGHLFVASAYQVDEITNTGTFVRTVVSDTGFEFIDMWGIQYNPATNKLFITQISASPSILRVNASTGEIEAGTNFNYANDLFLTEWGTLIVGSWLQTPRIYNQDLTAFVPLGTGDRQFVTQCPGLPSGRLRPFPRPRPTPAPRP